MFIYMSLSHLSFITICYTAIATGATILSVKNGLKHPFHWLTGNSFFGEIKSHKGSLLRLWAMKTIQTWIVDFFFITWQLFFRK